MGHDFITCGDRYVLLKDWDIWLLHHFLLTEAEALGPADVSADEEMLDSLRSFFENWRWIGPGVVMGTDLASFVRGQDSRRELLLLLFHRVIARLEKMGKVIPLDYLDKHINASGAIFGKEQPTEELIETVKQLCEMVEEYDMRPEELLNKVNDRDSLIAFVRALAAERTEAERIEREHPKSYIVDGALDWKNADIASFLYSCLDYFSEKPFHKPELAPSWQMFADFLYHGKIIE